MAEKSLCFALVELAGNPSSGTPQKTVMPGKAVTRAVSQERHLDTKIARGGNAGGSYWQPGAVGCHTFQEPGARVAALL